MAVAVARKALSEACDRFVRPESSVLLNQPLTFMDDRKATTYTFREKKDLALLYHNKTVMKS